MQVAGSKERIVNIVNVTNRNGEGARKATLTYDPEVDFSIFGTQEIRDILKSKAHCLHAGFSVNHVIIKTLNQIRNHYIQRVGLATYLSQMLGPVANVELQHCTLYDENGREIELYLNGNNRVPLQRFIAKHFARDTLPAMVKVQNRLDCDHVEIRYL